MTTVVSAARTRSTIGFFLALLALVLALAASLALGARSIPNATVWEALWNYDPSNNDHSVVINQRLDRTVLGAFAGAALGVAGTLMQGLTRNPLADPGLLGVNAGSSVAVLIAISFFGATSTGFVTAAFIGAAGASALVYVIGSRGAGGATPIKLALTGAAVTAGFTSLSMLILTTDIAALNSFRFWSVGSLTGRDIETAWLLAPFVVIGLVLAIATATGLNLLALGDDAAAGLGQNVALTRGLVMVAIVLLCGSATAMAGPIVFVGLMVPHILRALIGPDYRWLLILAIPTGAAVLLVSDVIGRLVALPGEVEAGLIVAVIGAPLMIALIQRKNPVAI